MNKLVKSSVLLAIFSFVCVGDGQAFLNKVMPAGWYFRVRKDYIFKNIGEKEYERNMPNFKNLYHIKTKENNKPWNKLAQEANSKLANITSLRKGQEFPFKKKRELKRKLRVRKFLKFIISLTPKKSPVEIEIDPELKDQDVSLIFKKEIREAMSIIDEMSKKERHTIKEKLALNITHGSLTLATESIDLAKKAEAQGVKTTGALLQLLKKDITELKRQLAIEKRKIKEIKKPIKTLKKQYNKTIIKLIKLM